MSRQSNTDRERRTMTDCLATAESRATLDLPDEATSYALVSIAAALSLISDQLDRIGDILENQQ